MVEAHAGLGGFLPIVGSVCESKRIGLWAMYQWRGMLIREGHWHQEPKPETSAKSRNTPIRAPRFAKVAVTDLCPPTLVTVRLHLANGRRAEIDLMGVEQLEATITALERQP